MLLPAALVTSLTLLAGEVRQEAVVLVTRRSGVTQKSGLELADAISTSLKAQGVPMTFDARAAAEKLGKDSATCEGAAACALELGLQLGVAAVVTVEIGKVLKDLTLQIEIRSVEENGAKWGNVDVTGTLEKVKASLVGALGPLAKKLNGELAAPTPTSSAPSVAKSSDAPRNRDLSAATAAPGTEPEPTSSPGVVATDSRVWPWITLATGGALLAGGGIVMGLGVADNAAASGVDPTVPGSQRQATALQSSRDMKYGIGAGLLGAAVVAGAITIYGLVSQ